MVFIPAGQYDRAYDKIKTDALKGDCTVQLYVAPDGDSLCAASILMDMLKSDFIRYSMAPTADLVDLHAARDSLIENPGDFQTVILINAGGVIDVLSEFKADEEGSALSNITFYIIDSHRPLHLANVFDEERVYIFDDGETAKTVPKPDEVLSYSDDEDDEDDDGFDSAAEEDGEAGEGGAPKSKRRRTDGASGRMSPRSRRELREAREYRLEQYYAANSYGVSAAVLMWNLASDLGKTDNRMLWLSIVGLTDQFLHDRISITQYVMWVERLNSEVTRLNALDEEAAGEAMDKIKISAGDELQFMVLRHWSVYEAMLHSRYVATRFATWKQSGKKLIRGMLAKMGMSLAQCNQKYLSMDYGLKGRLFNFMAESSGDFDLDNVIFPSFVSQAASRHQYSASDVVHSISGLLEAKQTPAGAEPESWQDGFYEAMDALRMDQPDKAQVERIHKGMGQCKRQHAAILRVVESVVEGTNGVRKQGHFRLVQVKDHADQAYFAHHPTLQKLGLYLMDYFRFNPEKTHKKGKAALPLVVCALNPALEMYTVIGLWNTQSRTEGAVVGNEFGRLFEAAIDKSGVRARSRSFDSSVIAIKSDDLNRFLLTLQHGVSAGRR